MAWSTPRTWVAGELVTAAIMNAHVRDQFNVTAAAAASTAGGLFVATGTNTMAERIPTSASDLNVARSTASVTYVALTGAPAVTVTTGTIALVLFSATLWNSSGGSKSHVSVAVSSATTRAANDDWGHYFLSPGNNDDHRGTGVTLMTGLTAGSNVFTINARASANTMNGVDFELIVIPLS